MADSIQGTVDELLARAQSDSDLRARLLADPRGTIAAETGMTVPADWALVATDNGGVVELGFENGELPEEYLAIVSGGNRDSCGAYYQSQDA
jgi:hypothetical protein